MIGLLAMIGLSLILWTSRVKPEWNSDDQVYTEAVMEDALRESDAVLERLTAMAVKSGATNADIIRASDHLKIVSADREAVIARASRVV